MKTLNSRSASLILATLIFASVVRPGHTAFLSMQQRASEKTTTAVDKHPTTVTPPVANEKAATDNQSSDAKSSKGGAAAQWLLVTVAIITAAFICWQAWETRRAAKAAADSVEAVHQQTIHISRQAVSMRRQTTILRRSADAQIASERAWLVAELVPTAM